MNHNIPLETALHILAIAYLVSVMLLLAASNAAFALIETIEEIGE